MHASGPVEFGVAALAVGQHWVGATVVAYSLRRAAPSALLRAVYVWAQAAHAQARKLALAALHAEEALQREHQAALEQCQLELRRARLWGQEEQLRARHWR